MKAQSKILIGGIILCFCSLLQADLECKGSEGGSPFINITKEFKSNTSLLKTPGLVKDFLVRENKNEVVYRTEDNVVRSSLSAYADPIAVMSSAFSRAMDPWGDFVLAKQKPTALNTRSQSFYRVGQRERQGKDLYWNGTRVFSVEEPDYSSRTIWYSISYLNGASQRLGCKLSFENNVKIQVVSSGHTYPYLFFYTTQEFPEGTKVHRYALRLEAKKAFLGEIPRCELTDLLGYKDLMPGKVKALYHFGNLNNPETNAWLMDIDHPDKRLLWSADQQCTYYKAPPSPILVLNAAVPVIAMQKEKGGINLIYPKMEKTVDLLENLVTRPLTSDNLWITRDKKSLYVTAQPENENAGLLFKVMLDSVQ